jgi:CBS domain-containing protein
MAQLDAGALPVGEDDWLVGMITDRDIAIRAVAQGRGPDAKVREVMSLDVKYCFEDEDLKHVAQSMADIQVRRPPVVNRDKRSWASSLSVTLPWRKIQKRQAMRYRHLATWWRVLPDANARIVARCDERVRRGNQKRSTRPFGVASATNRSL